MAGNVKKVEFTQLTNLIIDKKIDIRNAICSRHLINASYILSPNEYTLLNFLIFMQEKNVIKYSTTLLKQYDAATSRMIELYGSDKVHYSTSWDIARQSFISLIEKGYLIRLTKNIFMISPMLIFPKAINQFKLQDEYLLIISKLNFADELTAWCNNLIKNEIKNNHNKRK